jgi:hypothetical protein
MADDLGDYISRLFKVEGNSDPNATATGSNQGMGQFSPDLEAKYGINNQNRTDPNVQADAVRQEAADHEPALTRALGRAPSPGERYLAHQQGIGGAVMHINNPDQPAWQSMLQTGEGRSKGEKWARAAISGNPFTKGMDPEISSGDFRRGWTDKFERGMAPNMNYPINAAMGGVMGTDPTFQPQAPQQPLPMQDAMAPQDNRLFGKYSDRVGQMGDMAQDMAPWLMAIANPAAGATMLNNRNNGRYIVSSDKLGNQRVFDVHRGKFVDQQDLAQSQQNKVVSTDQATALAQTPEAQRKRAELDQEQSSKTLEALREGAIGGKTTHDLATEGLKLLDDPNVYVGPGAHTIGTAKSAALALPDAMRPDFAQGGSQTAALDKIFGQLQGSYLSSQKGVRFAGPELKFSSMANADLEKPKETNKQILQDYILRSEYGQKAFEMGNRHMRDYGVIGPRFNQELMDMHKNSPMSELNAVQPTNAPPPVTPGQVTASPASAMPPMPGSAPVVQQGFTIPPANKPKAGRYQWTPDKGLIPVP